MWLITSFLLILTQSQDHTGLVGSRPECQPYDCRNPEGYTFQFGNEKSCFWGRFTCDDCCYTDFTADGIRPCWTFDWTKEDCCDVPWAHDPTCDPDNVDCELSTIDPDSCTACGEVLTQPILTPAVGGGACDPESYTCVHLDGSCVEDRDCILGGSIDTSSCTSCGEVLTQSVVEQATGSGTCAPATHTCAHGDGTCVEDIDCMLGILDPSACTSCGEVLTQEVLAAAVGIGECNPQLYTCADGDGACVELRDCVLGDAIDPSDCFECGDILTQSIATLAQGGGVCDPDTYTCDIGDGACQEDCDYLQVGNSCPNYEVHPPIDYVFILDTTSVLTDEEYNSIILQLASSVELNLREEDNFAMINFSEFPEIVVNWTSGVDRGQAAEQIRVAPRGRPVDEPFIDYALQYALDELWEGNIDESRDQRTIFMTYDTPNANETPCGKPPVYSSLGIDLYALLPGEGKYDCFENQDVYMSWFGDVNQMLSQHTFILSDPTCGQYTPFDGFYERTEDNDFGPVYANDHDQILGMTYADSTIQVWQFEDPITTGVMISVYLTPGASLRPPAEQAWEYEGPDVLTVAYSAVDVECLGGARPTRSPDTSAPTPFPTQDPSPHPSFFPTTDPTPEPSFDPTLEPSLNPSTDPSIAPTTSQPTPSPTENPLTSSPSGHPLTSRPSTSSPSQTPSKYPTDVCKPFIFGSDYHIPEEIIEARTDFGFILDSSSSMSDEEFVEIMGAFADLSIRYFTDLERAGLMIFSSFYRHEFPIIPRTAQELAEEFLNTTRIYGATLTSTAMYYSYQEMWLEPGIIDGEIRQRAVLITDGKPSAGQDACSQTYLYQNAGIELYIVAIGDEAFSELQCFTDFAIKVIPVDDIEQLVDDLPKYLQVELIDRIHFDSFYDCTGEYLNGAPTYESEEGWIAYRAEDGHWTIRDPSGSINCDLRDTVPSDANYPEPGHTWTCFHGVFENTSVEYWSRTPSETPSEMPTITEHCNNVYMEEIERLQTRVDELQSRVNQLESDVQDQSSDLETCERKFDEIMNDISGLLSCDSCSTGS